MKKYLTKRNIANLLLFTQYILIEITNIYIFSEDVTKFISLILLIIGYWINTSSKNE